jgi:hypothetical protein
MRHGEPGVVTPGTIRGNAGRWRLCHQIGQVLE